MSTKLFDPAAVIATWGPNLLSGWSDGTFLEVTRDEEAFFKKVGADGEVGRSRNKNKGGTITVRLLQTSASNDVLSNAATGDELLGSGSLPFLIKDLFGTTLVMVPNAWVKKRADVTFGKELGDREWVFDCDQVNGVVGGSNVGP